MDPLTPDRNVTPAAGPAIAPGSPWPGAFEAIGMAFAQVKKNTQPVLVMVVVYVVLGILDVIISGGNEVTRSTASINSSGDSNFTLIGGLIFLLAGPVYALAIADRKKITLAEFFVFDVRRYFFVLFSFILLILLAIPAALTLGIALIWFIPWFAFVAYIIADTGVGPSTAFSQSKALGSHNKGKVWGIVGATVLLFIPALILMFIPVVGLLLATAYDGFLGIVVGGATAMLYRWIQHDQGSTTPAAGQAPVAPTPPTVA